MKILRDAEVGEEVILKNSQAKVKILAKEDENGIQIRVLSGDFIGKETNMSPKTEIE